MEPPPIVTPSSLVTDVQTGLHHILRLNALFATLPDPRVMGRVLYTLPEVLRIAQCSMVSDGEDFTDMGNFAKSRFAWLRQCIPQPTRMGQRCEPERRPRILLGK